MKVLSVNEDWPTRYSVDVSTGCPKEEPISPIELVMSASREMVKHTMIEGTHIICHPRHRGMFSYRTSDYARFSIKKNGSPDIWAGMEIIWSQQHGLEVLSDGIPK